MANGQCRLCFVCPKNWLICWMQNRSKNRSNLIKIVSAMPRLEILHKDEHFMLTDVQWDPSSRCTMMLGISGFALPSSFFKGVQPYQYLIYPYLLLQVWFDVHFFDHDWSRLVNCWLINQVCHYCGDSADAKWARTLERNAIWSDIAFRTSDRTRIWKY